MSGAYPVLHVGFTGSQSPARPARPWTRTFRGVPASVPAARHFVAELLTGCPAREVLVTCVSELSTNAITHTASGRGGVFTVEIDLPRDGAARISVTDDGGPSFPVIGSLDPLDPMAVDPMAEGGRGLALVAACTSRWGYADARSGLTVWAEACWPVAVPSPGNQSSREPFRLPELPPARLFPCSPDDDWPPGPAA